MANRNTYIYTYPHYVVKGTTWGDSGGSVNCPRNVYGTGCTITNKTAITSVAVADGNVGDKFVLCIQAYTDGTYQTWDVYYFSIEIVDKKPAVDSYYGYNSDQSILYVSNTQGDLAKTKYSSTLTANAKVKQVVTVGDTFIPTYQIDLKNTTNAEVDISKWQFVDKAHLWQWVDPVKINASTIVSVKSGFDALDLIKNDWSKYRRGQATLSQFVPAGDYENAMHMMEEKLTTVYEEPYFPVYNLLTYNNAYSSSPFMDMALTKGVIESK